MEILRFSIESLIGLVVILNPFGAALLFVSLTQGESDEEQKKLAKRTTFAVIVTLILFMFLGQLIFSLFSITLDAFRIAGGILLFGMGMAMLRGQHPKSRITEKERAEVIEREDISIIPMAIPILSGPGAIATAMVYRANVNSWLQIAILTLAVILAALFSGFILRNAHKMVDRFGKTALRIVTRIMGLIATTIAVQFIITGIKGILGELITTYHILG
ncbi:MAG TPA: hypothetical protein DHU63_05130 [Candidatus Marinimicrobia bacterium]|nr:MAG: hypothetical protein AUJ47_09785 [Candidatus Marinimicrobia bacterium CG1_02_48_14]HCW75906.1 hypothetical protein [Candidatus Neomarinimicrobiota bacterium]